MIDSHCHLADNQFSRDLDAVIHRAQEKGVEQIVTISDTLSEAKKCIQIAEKYDHIFCTVGVHPHASREVEIREIGNRISDLVHWSPKVKAIGEIGLDYHYDHSPRDVQREVFEVQLKLAKDLDMPVVIHNRESFGDMWRIVQSVEPAKAVLHCCTDAWSDVEQWVARGYLLGFTGIATYPSAPLRTGPHAEHIREVIKYCPLDQMMVETDAPYLAPVPHRGKRNEPAYVVQVVNLIAKIKGVSFEEVDRMTTKNTNAFFELKIDN